MTIDSNVTVASVPAQVETDKLKTKFMARSIPLQQDFHDLIDMADAGRLAVGLSPAQDGTKNTAKTGLIIGDDERLAVKVKTGGGLDVTPDGVSVKKGNGIDATVEAVSVKVKTGGGLDVAPDGVSVKRGNGIDASAEEVSVKVKTGGGLDVAPDGVSVKRGNGIDATPEEVSVKANRARGVAVTPDGVGLETNDTLEFESSGKLAVRDIYFTKSGDNVLLDGSIIFGSDGHGISFPGGSKIIKQPNGPVVFSADTSHRKPKITEEFNPSGVSNIASEDWVVRHVDNYASSHTLLKRLDRHRAVIEKLIAATLGDDTFAINDLYSILEGRSPIG